MSKLFRYGVAAVAVILAVWLFALAGHAKGPAAAPNPSPAAPVSSSPSPHPHKPQPPGADTQAKPVAFSALELIEASTHNIPQVVTRGQSVASLAWHYLPASVYMKGSDFEAAIRSANGLKSNTLKPGQHIMIPGIPLQPILDKPVTVAKTFDARAIYMTGWTAGSARGLDLVEKWKAVGGNAVVFDIKDFDGQVHVPFDNKYAPHKYITLRDLPKYIHWLHALHLHVIARIALFRDAYLAQTYPQFDVRSRKTGKPWLEDGQLDWVDPSLPEVQQYNLDLANVAANAGADEIQFDYVRFPAQGDQADAEFAYQKEHPDWSRSKIITDFVAKAYQDLHPKGVLVSLDVFGVMAWARKVDLDHTGQNIAQLARHCDVISPMIYPSHFFNFDGYTDPGDAPEHFIAEAMQRFQKTTQGTGVVLRPWLQAFAWRTKSYSVDYVLTEMRVARQNGGIGFLFWNAFNNYPKAMIAMLQVHNGGGQTSVTPETAPSHAEAAASPTHSKVHWFGFPLSRE